MNKRVFLTILIIVVLGIIVLSNPNLTGKLGFEENNSWAKNCDVGVIQSCKDAITGLCDYNGKNLNPTPLKRVNSIRTGCLNLSKVNLTYVKKICSSEIASPENFFCSTPSCTTNTGSLDLNSIDSSPFLNNLTGNESDNELEEKLTIFLSSFCCSGEGFLVSKETNENGTIPFDFICGEMPSRCGNRITEPPEECEFNSTSKNSSFGCTENQTCSPELCICV